MNTSLVTSNDPLSESVVVVTDADGDPDAIFGALANSRRRCLLAILHETDSAVPLEEAALDVAAWERDCDPDELSAEAVDSVLASLYHAHVPTLDDAGLVEFDHVELTVTISDTGATVGSLLGNPEDR